MIAKILEQQLRKDWLNWQNKAHTEDQISFIDFVSSITLYKGFKVKLKRNNWGEYKITFTK